MKIALATCMKLAEPDVDEVLLVAALEARGAAVRLLPWDDTNESAHEDELVVIRSTWNYYTDVDAFLEWVDRTGRVTRILNPPSVIHSNARKTYLRDLERRGIDIVPTEFVRRNEVRRVEEIVTAREWDTIVVKPVVSAASFSTQRFESARLDDAQRFLDDLTRERDVMVQRWMPAIDSYGERSLVWIDGELTHAIRKSPRFVGGVEVVSEEVPIADAERAFAENVLAPLAKELLYARVDVVPDESDSPAGDNAGQTPRLMELELIEPSLFLKQSTHALDRLTTAILREASGGAAAARTT